MESLDFQNYKTQFSKEEDSAVRIVDRDPQSE